ncbi:hypothetical protein CR513_04276, partial [Mucuna pruriens]
MVLEVEYRGLASNPSEITWISNLLKDLHFTPPPTIVLCENQVAVLIASNPTFHERAKHINIVGENSSFEFFQAHPC